jgi:hypothetical protein
MVGSLSTISAGFHGRTMEIKFMERVPRREQATNGMEMSRPVRAVGVWIGGYPGLQPGL